MTWEFLGLKSTITGFQQLRNETQQCPACQVKPSKVLILSPEFVVVFIFAVLQHCVLQGRSLHLSEGIPNMQHFHTSGSIK